MADQRDPVHTLALFIFQLGRDSADLQRLNTEARKEVAARAYTEGYAEGRSDVEKEMGLDGRAVLIKTPKIPDGSGGTASN